MQENKISSISVFCGSSTGNDDGFFTQAFALGAFLADHKINLVYGGARVGLMGAVADGALSKGGNVIGVLPDFIQSKELAHQGLTELIIVKSMHERKTIMDARSDGAIVLPGGFGTLDEMFELLTWGQLGLHQKPIAILNTNGFYDDLIACLDKMVTTNFLRQSNRQMLLVSQDIQVLFDMMLHYKAPLKAKWIDKEQL